MAEDVSSVPTTSKESLFEEVLDNGKRLFKCSICFRLLSRKQRIEAHLTSVHGKGPFKKTYKRYIDDPSIVLPRSTKYYQSKRLKTYPTTTSAVQVFDDTPVIGPLHGSLSSDLAGSCEFYAEGPSLETCNEGGLQPETEIIPESGNVSDDSSTDYSSSDLSTGSATGRSGESDTDSEEDEHELNMSGDEESELSFASTNISDEKSICMAVHSFVVRHHVTTEAAKDLIDLVKVTCPDSATFHSLTYSKVQEMCGNCEIFIHDICDKCFRRFPQGDPESYICSTDGCGSLRYKGSQQEQWKKCHKNSFLTVNLRNQLKDLLERKGVWKTIQQRIECRGKPNITDIVDGHYYGKLCKERQFLSNKSNISLIFNTDGAPLYSSSSVSLWPIFLAVNELPSPDRFSKQNMLMWGIWQGKGKPPFNVYFEPFAAEMIDLYQNGLNISLPNQPSVNVKVALLLGSADLQGKAYLMNMTQHNGESGCLTCEEPGVVVKQGKGHARCYPYRAPNEAAPKRTRETFLANAVEANQSRKRVAGVTDVTTLAMMPWFDLVLGMVPDYMHGCLLGITKTLLYKWLSPTNHKAAYFVGGEVAKLNKRLLQMRPPDFLVRLPRDLEKHFKNLKASELQAWLLYYGLPCLVGYLADKYLKHFAHLAEGIYILLGDSISEGMLGRAQDLLTKFYRDYEGLYGSSGCGLNVHNAGAHLADYVRGWGPLWAWSTFGFEDMNGTIMEFAHGTGNVCRQLIWMLHAQSRLRCEHEGMADNGIKKFIGRMLNTKRELKNLKDARGCQIAGKAKALTGLSQETMDEIHEKIESRQKQKVARIVRNGHVFFSKEYTRMIKRNACVVLFENGKVGEIQFFVWSRESGATVAVYKEIVLDAVKPFFFDDAGHHILRMKQSRSNLEVASVESIKEKVLYLDGNQENICIVRVPNFNGVCG